MHEVPHHFLLTLQDTDGRIATVDGLVPLIPGVHTRAQFLSELRQDMQAKYGLEGGVAVLFFSLTPNDL